MPILLINTGGTITMQQTDKGLAPALGTLAGAITNLREAGQIGEKIDIQALDPLIDSAAIIPEDWNKICQLIMDNHDRYSGFVVAHGTDTLAFTAAALCVALEGLGRPVVVTGSMVPLSVEGNDAIGNLVDAFNLVKTAQAGVWVQFAGRAMHGARTSKINSQSAKAFDASSSALAPRRNGANPRAHHFGKPSIAIFTLAPGATTWIEQAAQTADGIIIRCYGAGTAPDSAQLRSALATAQDRKIPVMAVSQSSRGGMNFNTYANGAIFRDHDVINGNDITLEAAYAKMHHLLSANLSSAGLRKKLAEPMCGEMTLAPRNS